MSVNTSGNLILCCKPQILCLALRAAPHILESRRVDSSFWKKGGLSGWAMMGVRRASLGVSPPRMAEGRRYYAVSSLIGRPGEDILQKNDDLSRLCTQSARSRKKKITHGPRTRVLCLLVVLLFAFPLTQRTFRYNIYDQTWDLSTPSPVRSLSHDPCLRITLVLMC